MRNLQKSLTNNRDCVTMAVADGRAICPICRRPTAQRIRPDTRVERLPLFCKYCRSVSVVSGPELRASALEPEPSR